VRTFRRLAGPLVLLAALYLVLAGVDDSGCGAPAPAPEAPLHIVPAHRGHIRELAIQFHREGAERFLPIFGAMFEALAEDTRVFVVVADEDDRRMFEAARSGWAAPGPRVRYVLTGHPITSWAHDRFGVLAPEGDGGSDVVHLLAPPKPMRGPEERARDWLVPWALRRELGARGRVTTAPFVFDGGDLIADEEHVFVASPIFARNPAVDAGALLRMVEANTGRRVVRIGGPGRESPEHHVGMFLTPLGGGRVAYGDVARGLEAIGGASEVSVAGERLSVDASDETRRRFDRVREDLDAAGLEAVPLPLVPTTERFVYLGYDNVLLDERQDGLHVLVPVYGVPALDAAALRAWRDDLGAIPHPIPVAPIVRLGGTVQCLAATLTRD
jgi:hypothetical protein